MDPRPWESSTNVVDRIIIDHLHIPACANSSSLNRDLPRPFVVKVQQTSHHYNVSKDDQRDLCWMEPSHFDNNPPRSALPPFGFEKTLAHSAIPHREHHLGCSHVMHFAPLYWDEVNWPGGSPPVPLGDPVAKLNHNTSAVGSITVALCKGMTYITIYFGGGGVRIRRPFPASLVEMYRFPADLGVFIFCHLGSMVKGRPEREIIVIEVQLDNETLFTKAGRDFSPSFPNVKFVVGQFFDASKDFRAIERRCKDNDLDSDSLTELECAATVVKMRPYGFYNVQGVHSKIEDKRVVKFQALFEKIERLRVYSPEYPRCTPRGMMLTYYDSWSLGNSSYNVEYVSPSATEGTLHRLKGMVQRLITKPWDPPSWTKSIHPYLASSQRVNHLVFEEDVPHLYIPFDLVNG
jgi:hypothetical protein